MVCPQLRAEALPIFYARNTFKVKMHNLDNSPMLKWLNRIAIASFKLSAAELSESFGNDPASTRVNLMLWLEHYFLHRMIRPGMSAARAGDTDVLYVKLFDMLDMLRTVPGGWAAIKGILEDAYNLLQSPKPRWA